MGTQETVADSAIPLPKGGGALQGIGEKFSPDLFTGTGNFTVPISLPAGRNGFQPQLNLVYSTGVGNGFFGLGWATSIPGVVRKTSDGIPRYDDRDIFILSGSEDLVPVGGTESSRQYRPRTEGQFARIIHRKSLTTDHWEVQSKDGLISFYGSPEQVNGDAGTIVKPGTEATPKIFSWRLTRTEDQFGNRIEYEYESDQGKDGPHAWKQPRLSEIRYVDYQNDAGQRDFLVHVSFEYENRPEDPFSDYRAGFEIRTTSRCKAVEIRTYPKLNAGSSGSLRVRRYEFSYANQSSNGASLLTQVQVLGFDDSGAAVIELPPLSFGYTAFDPQNRKFQAVGGRGLPAYDLANPNFELVDLFGCGLPSMLEMNTQVRYWRNLGGGIIDMPRPMQDAPPYSLADPGVQIVDANGDGRPDLLVTEGPLAGYYPMQFDGRWSRKSFQAYRRIPSFNLKDPEVHMVDLDGDGVVDAVRSSTRMECFFNDPKHGWQSDQDHVRWVPRGPLDAFPDVNLSDPRVKWGDMSGDGMQDIILVHSGSLDYWPNLGRGSWGARVHMRNSPTFPWGYDLKRVLIGDVDGDGAADLVYIEDRRVTLWINRHGNGWSNRVVIEGTPPVSDMDSVRLIDFLGTGVAGILWSRDADSSGRPRLYFMDFAGGVKPYLLSSMDNHLGAITRVTYKPSTTYYLEDRRPHATPWRTTLPFPVQVVAQVEVDDAISLGRLTTQYRYHHGYWDGDEREFRGFGMVEQSDTESFENHAKNSFSSSVQEEHFSPPILTKSWFHLGPIEDASGNDWHEVDWSDEWWEGDPELLGHQAAVDQSLRNIAGADSTLTRQARRHALRSLRGSVLRTEMYALDGSEKQDLPYTVTESAYVFTEVANPQLTAHPDLDRIFFPHMAARRTTQWERGDDPQTQFEFVADYDEFGQPRRQTAIAMPRRSARRQPLQYFLGSLTGDAVNETRVLATQTRTERAVPDAGLYLYDRVSQARTFELSSPGTIQESNPNDVRQVLRDQWTAAKTIESAFDNGLQGWLPGQQVPASLYLLSHAINHYDGNAFVGRDIGKVGPYGTVVRSESLVLTNAALQAAYETGLAQTYRPTYLGGAATLPNGAPSHFGEATGYVLRADDAAGYHAGYYTDTKRQRFDFQDVNPLTRCGLLLSTKDAIGNINDPLDHTTQIAYDPYQLLPVKVTNAIGLETNADFNYQFLLPGKVVDINGNVSYYKYSPNGLLQKQWLLNQDGSEGGSETKPESEYLYDFRRYEATRHSAAPQPVSVHSRQRTNHALDPLDAHPPDTLIEAREFSDGFGRVIQRRAQADDLRFGADGDVGLALGFSGPSAREMGSDLPPAVGQPALDSVVVSGWQVYDNKGLVIEKYEPFFSSGWDFAAPSVSERGSKVTLYYDPRGQLIRTVNPDRTEQRVVYGVPYSVSAPDVFAPTPWESYTYDAADLGSLAPSSATTMGAADPSQLFTPTNQVIDALGRVRCKVQRNGTAATDCYATRSSYDIRGNILTVSDTLGRTTFSHSYDLLNRPLRIAGIDAGIRTTVLDAAGNVLEYRDSKGSIVLREYDALNRLIRLWAVNDATQSTLTLREKILYGDGGSRTQPAAARDSNRLLNRLGRIAEYYDEAGLLTFSHYDFKGKATEKSRRVVSDSAMAHGWTARWSDANAEADLDPPASAFQTNTRFDALSRSIEIQLPREAKLRPGETVPHRAKITPHYNRAGALQSVELDGLSYVSRVAHNAKGQRVLIAFANGTLTRYAYDPANFQLARLRSERFQAPAADTWQGSGEPLQDYVYRYDPCGNIVSIEERVRGCGVANSPYGSDRLVRKFNYDALYRLRSATGRACANRSSGFGDFPNCGSYNAPYSGGGAVPNQDNAPSLTELYQESYAYDPVGNMLELDYDVTGPGGQQRLWKRVFGMGGLAPAQWRAAPNNRLTSLAAGGTNHDYRFDDNGNLRQQDLDKLHAWDHGDRMVGYVVRAGTTPSIDARYLYGADGLRVKKWLKGGAASFESTVYVDGLFEFHSWTETAGSASKANNYVHVLDGQARIALIAVGDRYANDAGPPVQYQLRDHLGSSGLVLDDSGSWISREEFLPYGETGLGSFARKRYRFTGKERDEESGLSYAGSRYYCPWSVRWASCDPLTGKDRQAEESRGKSYAYCAANPLTYFDPDGNKERVFYVTISNKYFEGDEYLAHTKEYGDQVSNSGVTHLRVTSLDELVDKLKSELKEGDTIKHLTIASHGGGPTGQVLIPSKETEGGKGYQTTDSLEKAAARLSDNGLSEVQQKSKGATVSLHACNAGNSEAGMRAWGRFFGGNNIKVEGPSVFIEYYRASAKDNVVVNLDKDLKHGNAKTIPLDSKQGQDLMKQLMVNDKPLGADKDSKTGGAQRPEAKDNKLSPQTDKPEPSFEGMDREFVDPSRKPDAGRVDRFH